ncbi:DUF6701 domain-containing protein [Saccharospirillum sp. HFRX-1]|uniref:DUF6701 domain-containing protein n=1 Tax=unclassified Saccharospirillum TaxID=2633430 RepID=UPI003715398C
MRRWNLIKPVFGLLLVGCIGTLQAATYNLSLGQRPYCSTSWSVSGSTYRCNSNGRITLGSGDIVIANGSATLIANDGFNLRNATIGTTTSPIKIQSSYGDIDANGATVFGDLEASSGDIDLTNSSVDGNIMTGGSIDLSGGLVSGDVTSSSHGIVADGTLLQGTVTANGNIQLTDSEVIGQVTSTSNSITTTDSDLLGGAQSNGDIRITGGTLTGDFHSTSNRMYLDRVTMTGGSLNAGTIRITDSSLGGATGVVNANARNGAISLINSSVIYGDLTAPSWSTINVSDDSQVFGTCTPQSPGCINRPPVNCPLASGLEGEYFANVDLSPPSAFTRTDSQIDFNWGNNSPDRNAVGRDDFSIRWSGYLRAPTSDQFDIAVRSDDGVRLSVDEFLIINNWTNHSATLDSAELNLEADRYYALELEYYEATGSARIELLWDITNDGRTNFTPIPAQYLVHCDALLPTPTLAWRMDEPRWNGSPGEVTDSSDNNNSGTGGGNISTVPGFLCRGGEFDGVDDFIRAPSLYNALRGDATLSFWIRTRATGNDTPYLAPGISGVEESGGTDDIFWGWLDSRGHIGLAVGNDSDGKSKQAINDGDFHHVVLIRNASNGNYRIYIDGQLDHAGRQASGLIGTYFESLGRVENTNGGPTYFQGELDEVMVFEQLFSNGDVKLLYDLQRQGKNLDGSDRDLSQCGGSQPFCITDNFQGALDNSQWQVNGNGFTPRTQGGRLRLTDDAANRATSATLLQRFPSAGNRIQVEFDFYAYTNNDDAADGVAIVLSDASRAPVAGGYGGSLGYAQNNNANEDGFLGGWLGAGIDIFGNYANATEGRQGGVGQRPNSVSVRGSGEGRSGYAYLAGTAANLSPALLTGRNNAQRYRLTVDHSNGSQALVSVYRDANKDGIFDRLVGPFDALTHPGQSAIPAEMLLTLTGSTGGSSATHEIDNLEVCATRAEPYEPEIHHFELVRSRATGLTCEPLAVAVRACLDAQCSSQYSKPFDIQLNANGPINRSVSGDDINSGDRLNLWLSNAGDYSLSVANSTPATTNASALKCFIGTTAQANCNVTMKDTGLRFFDPDDSDQSSLPLIDLVAGAARNISVQAVETDPGTRLCQGIFDDGETLDFSIGSRCSDPATCLAGEQVVLDGTNLPNPQDKIAGAERTSVALTFNTDSTASFEVMAPDVGKQPLLMSFELNDPDSDPSAITVISDQIDLRVRPAALQIVTVEGSGRTPGLNESVADLLDENYFEIAGAPFSVTLAGLDIEGEPTASFGRTTVMPEVTWSSDLRAPSAGLAGAIAPKISEADQWSATDDDNQLQTTGVSYSEVGVTALSGKIESYLDTDGVADVSVEINERPLGRFVPAWLSVSQEGLAQWSEHTYRYQGQPGDLSGLSLNIVAKDYAGLPLANYDGDLFRFGTDFSGSITRLDSQNTTGAALQYNSDDLDWQRDEDDVDYDADTAAQLDLADVELTWPRKTLPDANDVSQKIDRLRLSPAALTDSDGVCYKPNGDAEEACAPFDFELSEVQLHYGRLNADPRASGTTTQVILPVWVEPLTAVDPDQEPAFTFNDLVTADGQTSNTELTGLIADGVCRLDGENDVADCAAIAAGATGQLSGLTSGQGYFTVAGNGAIGVVGVRARVPNWLSWDWDDDSSTDENGPASMLYFGQYTGRPPLLFQGPGFR